MTQTMEDSVRIDGLVSPASFWFPEALTESAWRQHAPFAFWLIEALRPRQFVELGTHHGFSYLVFCQAVERCGLDARGYAVDTWQGDEHAGFYGNEVYARLRDLHDPRYGGFSRLVRSTFDDALAHFADRSIDLLHIDGRHFYDDAKHDFESWTGKLSDRGVVLFHDTNVRERGFGVFRLWEELRTQYPAFEFLHGHGLGVLGVGPELPERVKRLFEAAADARLGARIREAYARLGSAIEDRYLLARKEEEISRRAKELTHLRKQSSAAEQRLNEQNAELAKQNTAQIALLEAQVAQSRQDLALAKNSSELQLAQQDTHIEKLNKSVEEQQAKISSLNEEIQQERNSLAKNSLDLQLAQQDTHIEKLNKSLKEQQAKISSLNEELQQERKSKEALGRRHREATVKLNHLERKSNSSRWLLSLIGKKIIHMPRDVSRRVRSRQKRRGTAVKIATSQVQFRVGHMRDSQFRKYITSKWVLSLEPILSRSFAARMRNRMEKNAKPISHATHAKKDDAPKPALAESAVIAPWWWSLRDRVEIASGEDGGSIDIVGNSETTAIIIPVYNAPDDLLTCVKSVLRNTTGNFRLILIDDASPNPAVAKVLDQFTANPLLLIHRNSQNIGFSRTVNRGIELAGAADVVLLNSDTKVPPGWLRNLRIAAYSHPRIGTVSPFSNNAGAFSVPTLGVDNPPPDWLEFEQYARAVSQTSRRAYPRVPTNHGFCMYLRRDCLEDVGLFDAEAFPKGYGEENDFCMRAGRQGWIHVIDDATLVYHVGAASFGKDKNDLMKQGRAVIDRRYPDYKAAISIFKEGQQIVRCRDHIAATISATRSDPAGVLQRFLYVVSTRTGGTPQTNQDLMRALAGDAETFVLWCDSRKMTLQLYRHGQYVDLQIHKLSAPIKAFPHRSEEYDAVVRQWLLTYAIDLVHIRHIAWHSLGLIEAAKSVGLPIVFSFHDFYTICPTVKLLDDSNRFCGGTCTASTGECGHELWADPDFPPLKHAAIGDWKKSFVAALDGCDAFVTTSASAKEILLRNYPFLANRPFEIIPHGRDFSHFANIAAPMVEGEPLRLLVLGNISMAKGANILRLLAEAADPGTLEIHVLGTIGSTTGLRPLVSFHGSYARDELMEKVRGIRPHLSVVFSTWPETHCHTLTESWACGLPVLGFDFGAVGERIRKIGAGWLLDGSDIDTLYRQILELSRSPSEMAAKREATLAWQRSEGAAHTTRYMASIYSELYRRLLCKLDAGSVIPSISAEAGDTPDEATAVVALRSGFAGRS